MSEQAVPLSAENVLNITRSTVRNSLKTFIRFTGGEPTLYWNEITSILDMFEADGVLSQIPVLIQTNGIRFGGGEAKLDNLMANTRQKYLFELSLKGTNKMEFSLLTGKDSANYELQLEGFHALKEISRKCRNVAVVAVLGIYHSSVKSRSKYAFCNPSTGALLFEDPKLWDENFKRIWSSTRLKWVEPLRMSPKGAWDNILKRCGPHGSGILKYISDGVRTNSYGLFPMKPKSVDYSKEIVGGCYWP